METMEKQIELLSQSKVGFDENHVKELCTSSDLNKELLLEKSTFFGNVRLTRFLLSLRYQWNDEQIKRAFENAIYTDDVEMVLNVI